MELVKATPQMSRDRDRATFEAWGGPLPLDLYLAMVGRLRDHAWSRNAAVWLLRGEGGTVLSSCEIYRMDSRLGGGSGSPGRTYAIGNMYTAPAQRRQGHATALLSALAPALLREDPAAQAMILFSDVPLEIYERSGFVARPGTSLVFEAQEGDAAEGIDDLFHEDRIGAALALLPPRQEPFAVLPSSSQIDWHLEREWIFAELMQRPRPLACGARLGSSTLLWAADFPGNKLDLLLLHAEDRVQGEALLTCARRAAFAAGLAKIVLWMTQQDFPWSQGTPEDRTNTMDSVPMIRPLDPRCEPADWNWIPRAIWV